MQIVFLPPTFPRFLCFLRSIAAHRDNFVRHLSVRVSVCLSCSQTFLVVTHSYVYLATLRSSECCHYVFIFTYPSFLYPYWWLPFNTSICKMLLPSFPSLSPLFYHYCTKHLFSWRFEETVPLVQASSASCVVLFMFSLLSLLHFRLTSLFRVLYSSLYCAVIRVDLMLFTLFLIFFLWSSWWCPGSCSLSNLSFSCPIHFEQLC